MRKGLILLLTVLLCLGFLACNKTVEFDINFIVDGNVYATINTTGNETIYIPQNPTKEGYIFDGWYWDEGEWEKPFTANSLLDAPLSSDMNVYAKWDEIDSNAKHTHVVVIDEAIAPTCTTDGFTEGKHCSECNEVIVAQTRVDALGHTEAEAVVENNVAPDCITDGSYDSVVYCLVCSDEISRTSVTVDALGHNEETIKGKAATCTETGLTDGVKCNTCGETFIEQSEIPAKGHTDLEPKDYICDVCNADLCTNHTEETIPAKSPTCTETGLTEGKKCSVCGEILMSQTIVEELGHTEVTDEAVDATCASTGLTEGSHCSECGTVLVEQKVIPLGQHLQVIVGGYEAPTCTTDGLTDWVHCAGCNTYLETQEIIPATGHTEAIIPAVDATCSNTGLTEGKYCSVCNEILVSQYITSVIDCIETDWIIDIEPTSKTNGIKHTECTMCGRLMAEMIIYATGSEGLEYEPSDDGESYVVIGMGSCKDKDVIVPSVYNNKPVTAIKKKAFYCEKITSITIADSVISIGNNAFYSCDLLTGVYFCDNSQLTSIDNSAFLACKSLTNIDFSNNKHLETIGNNVFDGCIALTSVKLPLSLTNIGSKVFTSCRSITNIEVDDNNAHYKMMDGNLYSKDGSTLIQYAIGKTDKTFKIPTSVKNIGYYAFAESNYLTNMVIPDTVVSIEKAAFMSCSNLAYVSIGKSVTSVGSSAFESCYSLIEVCNKSSLKVTSGATTYGYVGYYAKQVITDESKTAIRNVGDYIFYDDGTYVCLVKYAGKDKKIVLPEYDSTKKYDINQYAFNSRREITDITLPDNVSSINSYAFSNCINLVNIEIPDGITYIDEYAFNNCSSLTSIVIPDSVTAIGKSAFYNCKKLTDISIGNGVVRIYSGAFSGCDKLKQTENGVVYVDKWVIGYDKTLTSVELRENTVGIADSALSSCTTLTNISMPESVKNIGQYAFSGCENLVNATFPENMISIGEYAFYNCKNLTTIIIPDGITNIYTSTFDRCVNLISVIIGKDVTSIGTAAFKQCTSLTEIRFKGTVQDWNSITFINVWNFGVPATEVICSDGTVTL